MTKKEAKAEVKEESIVQGGARFAKDLVKGASNWMSDDKEDKE